MKKIIVDKNLFSSTDVGASIVDRTDVILQKDVKRNVLILKMDNINSLTKANIYFAIDRVENGVV